MPKLNTRKIYRQCFVPGCRNCDTVMVYRGNEPWAKVVMCRDCAKELYSELFPEAAEEKEPKDAEIASDTPPKDAKIASVNVQKGAKVSSKATQNGTKKATSATKKAGAK